MTDDLTLKTYTIRFFERKGAPEPIRMMRVNERSRDDAWEKVRHQLRPIEQHWTIEPEE